MSCCLSPIEYLIEYADFAWQTYNFTMQDVLTIGHVFPNTINMCCPDYCSNEYMLIGQDSFFLQNYASNVGFDFENCCVNIYLAEFVPGLNDYKACCNTNNNAKCINDLLEYTNSVSLKEWFYTSPLLTTGLFEYNLINGNFGFCELVNIVKTKTPIIAEEYMLAILQLGLVIRCVPNGTFVGSIETYMNNYY